MNPGMAPSGATITQDDNQSQSFMNMSQDSRDQFVTVDNKKSKLTMNSIDQPM
jgi:hypothetical protein